MANMFPVSPAPHQDNTRPDQAHRPAVVFGHRGPLYNPNLSRPHENSIGNAVGGLVNYLNHHGPLKNFGQNSRSFGQEVKSTFNPTTKAGLVNVLTMIAPGAKGGGYGSEPLPEDVLSNWQPAGHFTNYSAHSGNALDRGVMNEGPNIGAKGASMRGLVRRAQGVGGYRQANPMDVIEAQRAAQSKLTQTRDSIKEFSNRGGAQARMLRNRAATEAALEKALGANMIPFRPKSDAQPFMDTQSRDYTDRMTLLNLQRQMPDNPILGESNPLMQALYDMLFPGKNLLRKPTRPGGYPYGGGPFG